MHAVRSFFLLVYRARYFFFCHSGFICDCQG